MEEEYLTIFQLTQKIKRVINLSPLLKNVNVKGEVSKVTYHSNGNIYIDLKDEKSKINCVIFPLTRRKLDFKLEEGMHVLVRGTVDIFSRRSSQYQLKINKISRDGMGNLHEAYLKLKKKLAAEGYFDPSHKKELPKFPKRIGIVTAEKGAAIRDMITTIDSRWPLCEILLFPSLVQGDRAPQDIMRQISLSVSFDLDVLIVGRGGGSPEDLWCFNDEELAKVIYDCPIPIVSAVGHENDHSISDLVADESALTPTDAGIKVVPDINEVMKRIDGLNHRINSRMKSKLELKKGRFSSILKRPTFLNPYKIRDEKSQELDYLRIRLSDSSKDLIHTNRNNFDVLRSSFIFKDPSRLLEGKSRDYGQVVDRLEVNSANFIRDKERMLERLRDYYVFRNPSLLYEGKSKEFNRIKSDLAYYSNNFVFAKERQLDRYRDSYILNNPEKIVRDKTRDYGDVLRDLEYCSNRLLKSKEDDLKEIKNNYIIKNPDKLLIYERNTVERYMDKLLVLNPLNTLKRGYTITKHDDKVISSRKGLRIGDDLEVEFDDGSVNAKVVDFK
ncbi:MAG: exodeoxyribonuclease VII large subunit [Methanobrevibacter sp.]|nr:exodeoxyribonuclease VII large subunit [Methanobrevibacter sp.]